MVCFYFVQYVCYACDLIELLVVISSLPSSLVEISLATCCKYAWTSFSPLLQCRSSCISDMAVDETNSILIVADTQG